jgi:hypothetical protein
MVRLALPASLVTIARPARPARGLPPPLTDQAESRRRPNWARTTFRSVGLSRRTSRVDRGRASSWFRVSRSASLSRAVINLSILNRTPLLLKFHGYDRSLLKIAKIPKGGNVAIGDFDQCRTIPSTGVDGVSVLRQPARLPRSNSHGVDGVSVLTACSALARMASKAMGGSVSHFFPGNSQACLDQNSVNNLLCAIAVQRVYRAAPACEATTEELSMEACRVFMVLGMVGFQK